MTLPFTPILALMVAGLLLAFATRRRWLRAIGVMLLLLGWAGCTPWLVNFAVVAMEARADRDTGECHDLEGIVMLTGGLARKPRHDRDLQALGAETVQRTLALLERDDPSLPLMISGGGYFEVAEAEVIRELVHRVAPARGDVLVESTSHDTWESAEHVRELWPPPRRVALATSAIHLPRARRAFETMGYTVCPWPLNRGALGGGWQWWALIPSTTASRKAEAVMHELGGWIVYGWREAPAAD